MITEMAIKNAFNMHRSDKSEVHGYEKIYFDVLNRNVKSLLEIGVLRGYSLMAWRDLLPVADIYGIDITDKKINEKFIKYADATFIKADSTNPGILDQINRNFDVIIDDGDHYYKKQIATFENFKNKFNKVYVIEDIYHGLEDVINHVASQGYNYFVYPTNLRRKLINESLITLGYYDRKRTDRTVRVDLHAMIIFPIQK